MIVEAMAVLAVERPQHPVAWLASFALAHSELADDLVIVKKCVALICSESQLRTFDQVQV